MSLSTDDHHLYYESSDSSSEEGGWFSCDSDEEDNSEDEQLSDYPTEPPSNWSDLPLMLLEQIYLYLNIRERYACSRVCWSWYRIFRSARIWRHLVLREGSFSRLRYSLQYRRYDMVISQTQVQLYLSKVGAPLRRITILPIEHFYNLSVFLKVLRTFIEFFDVYPVKYLKRFDFKFACELRSGAESLIFGTGGQLLEELKSLFCSFRGMDRIAINNLLLDVREAPDLLSGFICHNRDSLRYLEILNVCKVYFPHFHVTMFPALRTLVISPSQISDEIVVMLALQTRLEELVIIQDKYTCDCEPVTSRAWLQMRDHNPSIRVILEVRSPLDKDIMIQPDAPVHTILIKTPYTILMPGTILQIIDNYKNTLRVLGQLGLPRKHGSRCFHDRCDTHIVMLAGSCPKLERLIIRERLSTTTLLIIAYKARNLRQLAVRQNAMIKKFDWPRLPKWSLVFYTWLKQTAKCEELVQTEVSKLMGCEWKMLSDKWFKSIYK